MQKDSINISLVDDATEFDKSLQELRDFGSQLYSAADYCETIFLKEEEDKRIALETAKECVWRAVVTVVDHIGSMSASLESLCLSNNNSIPQTQQKIDILKLRIGAWQQHSHKLALPRFYWSSDFPRHYCRYILPPSTMKTSIVSRDTEKGIEAKGKKEDQFETEEPLFLQTYNCKPALVENSTKDMDKKCGFSSPVVPVRDGQSILPKAEQSTFQFQEARKLKRSMINWKMMQNKDITSLIRRGKRVLA
ncbi:hypothetical protein CDL12_19292 [Handroanthus impetiginosus]|uniref:Protein ABIL5 n=1 Tax=Handroanthus impetiginosus TaxID=429701 RepID=A0A2G9GS44_9LAMI|nr:hypothetical protein CDL12_19292 [Handroanthus impetiginosus]